MDKMNLFEEGKNTVESKKGFCLRRINKFEALTESELYSGLYEAVPQIKVKNNKEELIIKLRKSKIEALQGFCYGTYFNIDRSLVPTGELNGVEGTYLYNVKSGILEWATTTRIKEVRKESKSAYLRLDLNLGYLASIYLVVGKSCYDMCGVVFTDENFLKILEDFKSRNFIIVEDSTTGVGERRKALADYIAHKISIDNTEYVKMNLEDFRTPLNKYFRAGSIEITCKDFDIIMIQGKSYNFYVRSTDKDLINNIRSAISNGTEERI